MSGRCRHRTTRRMWRIGESWCGWVAAVRAGLEWEEFGARICNHCGEWLPLGHSDETPERVAVEIRAAALVADLPYNPHDNERTNAIMSSEERLGWSIAESSMCEHSKAWLAGYLARIIATHEET